MSWSSEWSLAGSVPEPPITFPVLTGVSGSDRMAAIAAKVFEFETVEELVEWVRAT